MKKIVRYYLASCCALCLSVNAAYGMDTSSPCSAKKAAYQKLLDAIKNLPIPKQVIALDKFLSSDEDPESCFSNDLSLHLTELETDLVRLDANGVQIRPENTDLCNDLKPGRRCGYPFYEGRPIGETPIFAEAIPLKVKTLRVVSKSEGAKLVGIYDRDGKPIPQRSGVFKRPPDGKYIFALYRVKSELQFRKFGWTINSKK